MLVVISPAKKLDWSQGFGVETTDPVFRSDAEELAERANELSPAELSRLMRISDKLARLNSERFAAFEKAPAAASVRPAVLTFAGDTYAGLEARTMDTDARRWAQARLRILSGLYGVLRPFDGIQPYRLEMGTRLSNARGRDLYAWWGDRPARALDEAARDVGTDVLVNCASQEYFAAVDTDVLGMRVITPVFMEDRGGEPRVVSFYAKKARGAMARFICENRLTDPEDLKSFDAGGYTHVPGLSQDDRWVFVREAAAAAS